MPQPENDLETCNFTFKTSLICVPLLKTQVFECGFIKQRTVGGTLACFASQPSRCLQLFHDGLFYDYLTIQSYQSQFTSCEEIETQVTGEDSQDCPRRQIR